MSLFDLNAHRMICSKGDFTKVYLVEQVNGQLIATFKHVRPPRRGTEVFIKKLPRDVLLQDIVEFAVRCGDVYRIRLLMDFSGYNRGYCFVTYFNVTSARKAILTLNGENMKGNHVLVKLSFDNNKLEMRGIPPDVDRAQIFEKMSEIVGNGLKAIITFKKSSKERGSGNNCVLKYDTHRHALEARKQIWPRIKLWKKTIEVDWAVPREIIQLRWFWNNPNPPKPTVAHVVATVATSIRCLYKIFASSI
ncbi:hypothetical protein NQ318_016266 [Aromia moschata]|uniref:RRM domain-containing protein n=1 Tax=Aromia moschata TaxID=1265417 RepID=A0AAV8Y0N4_9CUCU|nr:hypothetical protein NQ318_016266 [Aromia moschata]